MFNVSMYLLRNSVILTVCRKEARKRHLVNSEDRDEMPHKLAPHQGPPCLLGYFDSQRKKVGGFTRHECSLY